MTELELQLISTEELSKELTKRFDAIIIYGIQKNMKANAISDYYDHWVGDHATLIGLCDLLKDMIKKSWDDKEKE